MSLKKCKECGNEVSTKAESCPKCGAVFSKKIGGCSGCLLTGIVIIFILIVIGSFTDDDTSETTSVADSQPKVEITREEYKTTAYDSRLLLDPNSNTEITRVPPNTKLKILQQKTVQQGQLRNIWYMVNYQGYTGWISQWNIKENE